MIIRRWIIRQLNDRKNGISINAKDVRGIGYVREDLDTHRSPARLDILTKFYSTEAVAEGAIARYGEKDVEYEIVKVVFRTDSPDLYPEYFGEDFG